MSVKLENKQTTIRITNDEDVKYLNYLSILSGVIGKQAVDTAWTLDELKVRLSVIDLINSNIDSEFIEVTDEQKELIKNEVSNARWVIAHADIVEFVEYLMSL